MRGVSVAMIAGKLASERARQYSEHYEECSVRRASDDVN